MRVHIVLEVTSFYQWILRQRGISKMKTMSLNCVYAAAVVITLQQVPCSKVTMSYQIFLTLGMASVVFSMRILDS
jgi:hypothetical protein